MLHQAFRWDIREGLAGHSGHGRGEESPLAVSNFIYLIFVFIFFFSLVRRGEVGKKELAKMDSRLSKVCPR